MRLRASTYGLFEQNRMIVLLFARTGRFNPCVPLFHRLHRWV